jgi:hypothetical protein
VRGLLGVKTSPAAVSDVVVAVRIVAGVRVRIPGKRGNPGLHGRVVVEDYPVGLAADEACVGRRTAEVDEERLVLLRRGVPDDLDSDGLGRLAGSEVSVPEVAT